MRWEETPRIIIWINCQFYCCWCCCGSCCCGCLFALSCELLPAITLLMKPMDMLQTGCCWSWMTRSGCCDVHSTQCLAWKWKLTMFGCLVRNTQIVGNYFWKIASIEKKMKFYSNENGAKTGEQQIITINSRNLQLFHWAQDTTPE